jgi:DNA polymerase elongation subunit (family B)
MLDPMNDFQKDALQGVLAFDLETFSPEGFPYDFGDPIVNFSLVAPLNGLGFLSISVIGEADLEGDMLNLLYGFMRSFRGFYLMTYNGERFDLEYAARRGRLYGLDFSDVFSSMRHIDVYRIVRRFSADMPRYDQKSVEASLDFRRIMRHVSGGIYHHSYRSFLESGSLEPAFYNIEDSYGCLRIAHAILRVIAGRINFLF